MYTVASGAGPRAVGTERGRGGGSGESRADRAAGGTLSALPAAGKHSRRGLGFNRVGSGSKPSCAVSVTFNDPKYPSQWHLHNDVKHGMDVNVTGVWERNKHK